MQNKIFINKYGVLELYLAGDQTFESIRMLGGASVPLVSELKEKKRRISALVDISGVRRVSIDSNRAALHILDIFPFDKVAVVGGSRRLKEIASLIILAAGKSDTAKVFENKSDAVAWIYEGLAKQRTRGEK